MTANPDSLEDVASGERRRTARGLSLSRAVHQLLQGRSERLALLAIGVTASIASFSEAIILVVVSLGALRLAQASPQPVDLPFGLPADELSTPLLLGLGLAALMTRLAALVANIGVSARLITAVQRRWRARVVKAFQDASWEVQVSQSEGYLQMLSQTYVNRLGGVLQNATIALTSGIGFLSFICGSFLVDPIIALALSVVGASLFALFRPISGTVRRLSNTINLSNREYNRLVSELALLGLEHRSLGASEAVASKLGVELERQTKASRRQIFLQTIVPQLYTAVGYLGILVGLGLASGMETERVALMGAIVLMMIRSLTYGQTFIGTKQAAAAAEPFVAELLQAIRHLEEAAHLYGDRVHGSAQTLDLSNVTLGYQGRVVLGAASLRIESGESVGLIGPSGGGKSTLAMALLGLVVPIDGVYRIDGIDSREYSEEWWTKSFGIVPQKAELFDGTIADNIRFHRSELSQEDLASAAEDAHLGHDLSTWSDHLEHAVGPRGSRLSGGQRQRVAIARALAGHPHVLIMDEPTSSLDSTAEDAITNVLGALQGNRTLIVIAHRISTLAFCDRVMLIQDGRVVEIGSGQDIQRRTDLHDLCHHAMFGSTLTSRPGAC